MTDETEEEWRPCVGWPEYEVSNMARVKRVKQCRGARAGHVKSQTLNPQGYPTVMLGGAAGKDVRIPVHQLMVAAFLGALGGPEKFEVNHKNGVKDDNRLENLERVTHQQNCQHAYANGLNDRGNHCGERCGAAKLTEKDVVEIKKRLSDGEKGTRIADDVGMSSSAIYGIKNGHYWSHIGGTI
jgi:hypothetical protein